MKRLMTVVAIVLFAAPGAFAASKTMTGKISDSMCGASHKAMAAQHGGKVTDAACTEACAKAGGKYVFAPGKRSTPSPTRMRKTSPRTRVRP